VAVIPPLETRIDAEKLRWAREMARCEQDVDYLSSHYLRIKSKTVIGFPNLKPNRVQRFLHEKMQDQWKRTGRIRQCWGKIRQCGASTEVSRHVFHQTAFRNNRNAFMVNYDEPNSYELFDVYPTYYDSLPVPLRPTLKTRSKSRIEFKNRNSKILAAHALNLNVGASQMNHVVHLTEVARYKNAHEIQASLFPSISEAKGEDYSLVVLESTSRYGGDWFKDFCEAAQAGENGYEFSFVPYFMHEDYTAPVRREFQPTAEERDLMKQYGMSLGNIAWRRQKRAEYKTNVALFEQEYACCLSGDTRISTDHGMVRLRDAESEKTTESGRILGWLPQGLSETLLVRTSLGYEIVATPEHLIATASGGWVDAASSLGSRVELRPPRFAEREETLSWSDVPSTQTTLTVTATWGRFLGYFMGDGSYAMSRGPHVSAGAGGTLSVCCDAQDGDVILDVERVVRDLFGAPMQRRLVGPRRGGCDLRASRAQFFRPLLELGVIERRGPERRWMRKVCVPEAVFRSPRHVVREFLRALFECDGSVRRSGNVLLFSKYEDFLRDIQLLLLGWGITSRRERWKQKEQYGPGHVLALRAEESEMFHATIGFIGARKSWASPPPTTRRGRRRQPVVLNDIVTSVVPSGLRAVYDLVLPPPHTFSANGIAVHNSWESSWVLPLGTLRTFDWPTLERLQAGLRPGQRMTPTSTGLRPELGGPVEVWQPPQPDVYYDIGVDPSQGRTKDADWTGICVVRRDRLEQVAECRVHMDPAGREFFDLVYWLGHNYNTAQLNPDITGGWGLALMSELQRRSYPNIWRWRRPDDAKERVSSRLGFLFTQRDKARLVSNAVTLAQQGQVVIHSQVLHDEMRDYLNVGLDEWGPAPGGTDDSLTGWMLALIAARDERWDVEELAPGAEPEAAASWAVHDVDADLRDEHDHDMLALGPWRA